MSTGRTETSDRPSARSTLRSAAQPARAVDEHHRDAQVRRARGVVGQQVGVVLLLRFLAHRKAVAGRIDEHQPRPPPALLVLHGRNAGVRRVKQRGVRRLDPIEGERRRPAARAWTSAGPSLTFSAASTLSSADLPQFEWPSSATSRRPSRLIPCQSVSFFSPPCTPRLTPPAPPRPMNTALWSWRAFALSCRCIDRLAACEPFLLPSLSFLIRATTALSVHHALAMRSMCAARSFKMRSVTESTLSPLRGRNSGSM